MTFLGTNRSFYAPESSSTLTIPQKTIPWEILPRRDVIVIRIEYAASSNVSFFIYDIDIMKEFIILTCVP